MRKFNGNGFTGAKRLREQAHAFIPIKPPGLSSMSHLMGKEYASEVAATIWLNVPYERKDEAKALGARWNPAQKQWWLPKDVDPIPFIRAGFLHG